MTHDEIATARNLHTLPKSTGKNDYGRAHCAAWNSPKGFEVPIVGLIKSAIAYADTHRERYESGIGDDGVLGEEWESIVRACLGLLNGDCGRLDCGTLDGMLREMLRVEGFDSNQ